MTTTLYDELGDRAFSALVHENIWWDRFGTIRRRCQEAGW